MDTQDKRFLAAALGEGDGGAFPCPVSSGVFPPVHWSEWPFAPHKGIRTVTLHSTAAPEPPYTRMVLTAAYGGDLPGVELSVGLDLTLEPLDTNDVFGKSEHLTGQLVTPPHTAPTTKNTVQIDFGERLVEGTESFGLSHVRGRLLWQATGTSSASIARCRSDGPQATITRLTRAPSPAGSRPSPKKPTTEAETL